MISPRVSVEVRAHPRRVDLEPLDRLRPSQRRAPAASTASSGSVSHSACQPPSPRSCSCTIAGQHGRDQAGRADAAADSTAAQPTGLRLCGIVDEPPLPSPRRLERLADLGLHQERDVAGDLAERAGEQAQHGRDLGHAVALPVPGQARHAEVQLGGQRRQRPRALRRPARPACRPPRRAGGRAGAAGARPMRCAVALHRARASPRP